jgi:protein transport protein SEC61 subunit gamma-like protein
MLVLGFQKIQKWHEEPEFTLQFFGGLERENMLTLRKLFYSKGHWVSGMSEDSKNSESKIQQLKDKFDLDELGDMDMAVPSVKLGEYIRVLKLARKPTREEFNMIAKVSLAGMAIIGSIGFLIYAMLTELPAALG